MQSLALCTVKILDCGNKQALMDFKALTSRSDMLLDCAQQEQADQCWPCSARQSGL